MIDTIARAGGRGTTAFGQVAPVETDSRAQSFAHQLAAVLSTLDCLLDSAFGLYVSADLTGGRLLYRLLAETGLRNSAQLQERWGNKEFRRRVLEPQTARALDLARSVRRRHPEELVVAPAHFRFEGWIPQEYRTLWATVIRTRIQALHFGDDWEYSDSCAQEFKIAWEIGLPTFDAEGQPISLGDGRFRIQTALLSLETDGFDTSGLAAALQNLGRQNRVAPASLL